MKVAILTLPFHSNYGGIMQAYALQTVLQRMGHDIVVIDKDNYYHRPWWRQQVALGAYIIRKYLLRQDTEYVNLRRLDREKKAVEKNVRAFVNKHLNILMVRDLQKDFPKDVDAVVVGSDQVWRPKYFTSLFGCGVDKAYLSFLKDRPLIRVAYAASFGTDVWEYSEEETRHGSSLLGLFDAVSTREFSGVSLCREKLNRADAVQMPDPTLLLSPEDYRHLYADNGKDNEPYLFYYVLDETDDSREKADSVAREYGLRVKRFSGDVDDARHPLSCRIKAPVEEWLCGIANADYVFTDSFHACVFSILFEKPFQTSGNEGRGMDRFRSLFSVYGQGRDRGVLEDQRKRAFAYLMNSLNGS